MGRVYWRDSVRGKKAREVRKAEVKKLQVGPGILKVWRRSGELVGEREEHEEVNWLYRMSMGITQNEMCS